MVEEMEDIENRLLLSDPSFVRARKRARDAATSLGNMWKCLCGEFNAKSKKRCEKCDEPKAGSTSAAVEDVDLPFETRPYDKRCSFAIGLSETILEDQYV